MLSVFEEFPVWGGLDLSSRQDLTALVLVARDDDHDWHVWCHFWSPEATLRERSLRDRTQYDVWAREGLLTATPGNSIDYAWVAEKMGEICEDFDIRGIGYDPWRINDLAARAGERGDECPSRSIGQGFKSMGPAIEALESEAVNGRIRHGMHPVLTWCASNAIGGPTLLATASRISPRAPAALTAWWRWSWRWVWRARRRCNGQAERLRDHGAADGVIAIGWLSRSFRSGSDRADHAEYSPHLVSRPDASWHLC